MCESVCVCVCVCVRVCECEKERAGDAGNVFVSNTQRDRERAVCVGETKREMHDFVHVCVCPMEYV